MEAGAPTRAMRALARAMVAEARIGADGTPADLVIVVDDLEVHNLDQPARVAAHFRNAVAAEVTQQAASQAAADRLSDRLRETCSFHLLAPMVEAYFFGDPAALERAGCSPDARPQLVDPDVERFESSDPEWLPVCLAENERRLGLRPPQDWWREECHAKRYLEWLIEQASDGGYEEVLGGVEAFSALDWPRVPVAGTACAFARAMFEDIADFFGVANPLGAGEPSPLTYPQRSVRRETLLLRNL